VDLSRYVWRFQLFPGQVKFKGGGVSSDVIVCRFCSEGIQMDTGVVSLPTMECRVEV
jgi:hypothetical protein